MMLTKKTLHVIKYYFQVDITVNPLTCHFGNQVTPQYVKSEIERSLQKRKEHLPHPDAKSK